MTVRNRHERKELEFLIEKWKNGNEIPKCRKAIYRQARGDETSLQPKSRRKVKEFGSPNLTRPVTVRAQEQNSTRHDDVMT